MSTTRFNWTAAAYGILTAGVVVTGAIWLTRDNPYIVPADVFAVYARALENALATQYVQPVPAVRTNYVWNWTADTNTFIRYGTNGLATTNVYQKPAGLVAQLYTNQYAGIGLRGTMPYTTEGYASSGTNRWIWNAWSNLTFSGFTLYTNANGKYYYVTNEDLELDYSSYAVFAGAGKAVAGTVWLYTNAAGWALLDYGPWNSSTSCMPGSSSYMLRSSVILQGSRIRYKTWNGDSPAYGPWYAWFAGERSVSSTVSVSIVRGAFMPGRVRDSLVYTYVNRYGDPMSDYEGLLAIGPHVARETMQAVTNALQRMVNGTNSLYIVSDLSYAGFTNYQQFINLSTGLNWTAVKADLGMTNGWSLGAYVTTGQLTEAAEVAQKLTKNRFGAANPHGGAYWGRQWRSPTNNMLVGYGESTNSWAEAKANAEAAAYLTNSVGRPQQTTYGDKSGGKWGAYFFSTFSYLEWAGCCTQIEHSIDFLVRTELSTNWASHPTFDANGTPAVQNQFALWASHTNTFTNNSIVVGTTNIGTWCVEPTNPPPDNLEVRGWIAVGDLWWSGEDSDADAEMIATWNFQYCTNAL